MEMHDLKPKAQSAAADGSTLDPGSIFVFSLIIFHSLNANRGGWHA